MAISENTVYNSLKMASDEINAAGGVLGKQLTVVAEDGASAPTVFAEKAQKLIRSDCVAAVFGGWTSSSRKAMLPVFEGNNALLFYPVLDEPVAGMSAEEKDETGRLLQRIARDRTVVVVEHDMDFMRAFAASVTVLHAGKMLSEGSVAAVQADPRVQEVYLGPGHHSQDEVAAVLGTEGS